MAGNHADLEKRLWDVADELRANSKLKSSEYAIPVLGLIFLRYADHKFTHAEQELSAKRPANSRRTIGKADYQALGVMYLPEKSRYAYLLSRPEAADIGRAINDAMKAVEEENDDLKGVLPKTYSAFDNSLLVTLLKTFAAIPMDIEGDVFGRVYEYFIGEFARAEGQKGGEDYTPTAVVKLIVEIIEPYHGRIFDPAGGAGGMFVQSGRFVENHKQNPGAEIMVYGQERVTETVRLAKMNLAVHGLSGEIREGNTYYEDIHNSVGRFDFTMSNPPFNVDRIDKDRLSKDKRFPFGMPRTDNGNYLWIQIFYSSLNPTGRAGFVMANSASDARGSEQEIRQKLIQTGAVDVMVAIGSNMFYNVTLPATLWFMDRAKAALPPGPPSPAASRHPLPKVEGRGGFRFQGLVERARELRKQQTPSEEALWQLLRNRQLADLKFRRQHQIGDYIVDFCCAEHGLVVELDGSVHGTPDRKKVDSKRDAYLRSLGHIVLRFPNVRVFEDTENVLAEIVYSIPSTSGRGAGDEGLPMKAHDSSTGARHRDTVLFLDARHIFRQIDRAHRDFTPEQIEFLANIVRLYRGEPIDEVGRDGPPGRPKPNNAARPAVTPYHNELLKKHFPDGKYRDVAGLCKVATVKEIEAQSWSLNPGRYVGVAPGEKVSDEDFKEQLEAQNEELEILNAQARELEQTIAGNVAEILET